MRDAIRAALDEGESIEAVAERYGLVVVPADDVRALDGHRGLGRAVLAPGWYVADDAVQDIHLDAATAMEAVQEWVDGGNWHREGATYWVHVTVYRRALVVDEDGAVVQGRWGERRHTVTVEPEEPACADGRSHEWRGDGGLWGLLGGVRYRERCRRCAARREVEIRAHDPVDGEQGSISVTYLAHG